MEEKNIFHPDFSNINIDKTIPTISISAVLGLLDIPFDRDGVAQKTYDKNFNNPNSQYYQKTVEEIIDMWESKGATSRRYGSMLDDYIGLNLKPTISSDGINRELMLWKMNNDYVNDERLHNLCDSFDNFYTLLSKSGDTVFIDRERTLYYKIKVTNPLTNELVDYYVKGRFDALFYNKRTNKWIVIDWKSSGTIDKVPDKWTNKFLGPMNKYPALNYYSYTNQLHFYKKALIESKYLPEGTTEDDVIIMIVNLPGKICEGSGTNFETHTAAMKYDSELMDKIFTFAIQKDLITPKDNPKTINENKEKPIENNTEQNNLDNIF